MSIKKHIEDRTSKEADRRAKKVEQEEAERLVKENVKRLAFEKDFNDLKPDVAILVDRIRFLEKYLIECYETRAFQDFLKQCKVIDSWESYPGGPEKSGKMVSLLKIYQKEKDLVCWGPVKSTYSLHFALKLAEDTPPVKHRFLKISKHETGYRFMGESRPFESDIEGLKWYLSKNPQEFAHDFSEKVSDLRFKVSKAIEVIGNLRTEEDFILFMREKVGFKLI